MNQHVFYFLNSIFFKNLIFENLSLCFSDRHLWTTNSNRYFISWFQYFFKNLIFKNLSLYFSACNHWTTNPNSNRYFISWIQYFSKTWFFEIYLCVLVSVTTEQPTPTPTGILCFEFNFFQKHHFSKFIFVF